MRRISSKMTFFYKCVFPVFWFGFLILFMAVPLLIPGGRRAETPFPFVIVPLAMMGFGYFIMRKLVFDLVDEVWEDGDSLVVKNRGQEEHIALSDIKNVDYAELINPPRVTIVTRTPTTFGDKIVFVAPARFFPWLRSPLIDDLIDQVDQARQRRAGA
jgi:hypothetical protein